MVFSSIIFLFTFFPAILILYYLAPEKIRNTILLIFSLVFYAWGEPVYIFLMVLSILLNYVFGLDIDRNSDDPKRAKKLLIFVIVINVFILGFFKYYGFLIESVNQILPFDLPYKELPLPVGISFYTFQILSYIIDVYLGKVEVQKNLISFGVYVTMFPQLIAGPIVQYADIDAQLKHRNHSVEKFGNGSILFIRGLTKKVLLANIIGAAYTQVSQMDLGTMSTLTAWVGCIAYTFQIYFDFSGYSDMAVGLGRMFGFEFLSNFDYPYVSKSITEFWRRWHISLGTWFRDYVYIPLGGNRTTKVKHIRNIMVVWLLTGLWHGASWNFVAWGLYYGLILLLEKFVLKEHLAKLPAVVQHIYSLLLIMTGWVFFFSPTLTDAVKYLGVMAGFGAGKFADSMGVSLLMNNLISFVILILASTPVLFNMFQRFQRRNEKVQICVQCAVYTILLVLCIAYLVTETYNPFLYFRF